MGRHRIPQPGDPSDERGGEPAGSNDPGPDSAGPDSAGSDDEAEIDPARYLRHGGDTTDLPWLFDDGGAESYRGGSRWRVGDQWRGGHRSEGGRRGVSAGVIVALVTVIVVVGTVILWRFFGSSLSHRSEVAAGRCVSGELTVAVAVDPSIVDQVQEFAERFTKSAKPVGDRCVSVQVRSAETAAVVNGFIGAWPARLGDRPALWIPGSSISAARLQAAVGHEVISDTRSLVTSPVLLAARPEVASALKKAPSRVPGKAPQTQTWATLPGLQSTPDGLAPLGLAGWGPLRLALPVGGNGDAAFLAAEAVTVASTPPGTPVGTDTTAVRTLFGAQPRLADDTLAEAMNVLLRPDDPAKSPVHAVVTTEQQLVHRAKSLPDAAKVVGSWLPPGPVPVADYPTVLLSGSWLSPEQVSAASEFARFARKPDQLAQLAEAGFRVAGVAPPSSAVTEFAALPSELSVDDDALRSTLASLLTTPAASSAVSIMVDRSMTTEEGGRSRLANVATALDERIRLLPPSSAVALWTFDGVEGHLLTPPGALGDEVGGQPRGAALSAALTGLAPAPGGAVSFTTLRLVYTQALANYRADQPNSVLVITTGPHTDRTLDGAGLQDFLHEAADPARPIAVNVIDFGVDSDQPTWQAVAQLTGGRYQHLTGSDSAELATALSTVLG